MRKRPTLWFALIGLCFLARVPVSYASPRLATRDDRAGTPASSQPVFEKSVEGFGQTDEDARARVVENIVESVSRFMEEQGEAGYKPTVALLQNLKIVPPANDISVTEHKFKQLDEKMQVATVKVQVLPDQLATMKSIARHQRADERQHWLGLGLSGILALLLVAVGYLRLEESTKGFYTGLLRMTALSILTAVGVVILYFSRSI